jgi:hypothetical protein
MSPANHRTATITATALADVDRATAPQPAVPS